MNAAELEPGPSRAPEAPEPQAHGLARNSILNLGTRAATLVLGLVVVPLLIHSIGLELYGVLGITWMVLSNLGWMDLGFSAACTRFVSRSLARGDAVDAARWAWTSVAAQTVLGGAGATALWLSAPAICDFLHVQPAQRGTVILTLRLFAAVLPVELVSRSLSGVMEAAQRFGYVNAVAMLTSLCSNGVYLLGVARGGDFRLIVVGLVVQRVAMLGAAAWAAYRVLPELDPRRAFDGAAEFPRRAREMIGFGGWVSVNSAVGPLLMYFDRWLMGGLLGVAALPYFTVPFNLVMQLMLVPGSVTSTLFPAFSALRSGAGWERAEEYYVRSHRYLAVVLLPVLFGLFFWAPELLRLWVGPAIALHATLPLRLLVCGLVVGLLAPLSAAVLQGAGRPDLLSKIYLAELPFNVLMMWFLVNRWGVVGAAAGYAIRTTVETLALWLVVNHAFRWRWSRGFGPLLRGVGVLVAGLGTVAAFFWMPTVYDPWAIGVTAAALALYGVTAVRVLLDDRDRAFLAGSFARLRR